MTEQAARALKPAPLFVFEAIIYAVTRLLTIKMKKLLFKSCKGK